MEADKRPVLYLVDGSSYIHRAFHAIRHLSTRDGTPTNAVYGVTQMLLKLIKDRAPSHLAVVFDAGGKNFRHRMYPAYKANRPPAPEELKVQFPLVREAVEAFDLPLVEVEGVEADDVIATLARQAEREGFEVVIVSGDKDLMQLVDEHTVMYDTQSDVVYDAAGVREKLGVCPEQVVDLLALMGDSSDNIPGVTKVGKKASIEVTQILGDHLAEARIVEDEPSDPILPGDVIHTPVWAPGEREHFVFTDGMDLDGDGKSDLQMMIHIVTMNGGVVDCYITDQGERQGEFTSKSRYLVVGEEPDETASQARLDAHRDLLTDAEQRGLMKITLKDLLDKMGWKNQTPVVRYGAAANPKDFQVQPPEGGSPVSTGTVSPLFQPRQPPRASRGTAY